jgi:hypothetical protein
MMREGQGELALPENFLFRRLCLHTKSQEETMAEPIAAEVQQLIREGRAAALAGDTFAARESFRRATEQEPASAEAWLGLSSVVPILAEKRGYLLRVLELDPGNQEARESLAYVEKLQAEGMQLAPAGWRGEGATGGDSSPLLGALEATPAPQPQVLHCYRHPERETGLRCVQCERPICGACAQITNVGQLCPECRKARRPANYKVGAGQIALGVLAGLIIGGLGNVVLPLVLGIPFLGLILAMVTGPVGGELAVRLSERFTRGKRGRAMQFAVGGGIVAGISPMLVTVLVAVLVFGAGGALLSGLLVGLWTVLAVTTAAARLK